MVCDLLREIVGEAWVELIDFGSAERVGVGKRRASESPASRNT